VLHVASGTPAKQWPIDHWQELIGRLVVEHGAQIVLVGTAGDRTMARRILSPVPCPGVADWTGRLDLAELGALLQRSDLFIGADSGPAHLAATVGTPAVVLFSGTNDSRQWRPFGEQVRVVRHAVECSPCHRLRCPLGDHPCMRRLSPEQVAEAAGALHGEVVCSAAGSGADRCGRLWSHESPVR
jgi:ADP-heptose:LPS heptosyltransferase